MPESSQPQEGIQATPPAPAISEAIQETSPSPDVIQLPPLPPAPPPAPLVFRWTAFDVFLLLLVGAFAFLLGSASPVNSDFWQHLATGRAIAHGEHQFGVDPYSFASVRDAAPVRWVNHSWLYDLGIYALYSLDPSGRTIVIAHGFLMIALLIGFLKLRPADASPLATLMLAALVLLVASLVLPLNSLIFSYLFLGIVLLLLWRGGALDGLSPVDPPKSRMLWFVPVVFLLWVNLDGWFILGLLLFGVVVLGNAVGGALGWRSGRSSKTEALALFASVVACLINPYHVHAFTVPAELAYLLGNWLPGALGYGGDTLRGLSRYDPDSLRGLGLAGAFSPVYFWNLFRPETFTVVWASYYVLLLVSVLSVVLLVMRAPAEGESGLPLGRLLVWLAVTVLSILQIRAAPFFALVAGPATLLNFTDLARRRRASAGGVEERGFNPALARLVSAFCLMLALGLAWPGWLHARIGSNSNRRVTWLVHEDPSLRDAALALAQADARHVFNFTNDIAHYCAWYAPSVRCFFDQRYALFGQHAAAFAKAKKELVADASKVLDLRGPSGADWVNLFRQHGIDYLVVTKAHEPISEAALLVSMCDLRSFHWTKRFTDGRTYAFAWSAAGTASPVDVVAQWNREAFGDVPAEKRAPSEGQDPPFGGLSLSELYLEGQPFFKEPIVTAGLDPLNYFKLVALRWPLAAEPATYVAAGARGLVPAGLLVNGPLSVGLTPLKAGDEGPPAALLLSIRQARRAIHEKRYEPLSYRLLAEAYRYQALGLEKNWATTMGAVTPPMNMRSKLREIQVVAALRNYLDLEPDDFLMRQEFALTLYGLHHYDAGQEQLLLARSTLEKRMNQAREKQTRDFLKNQLKMLDERVKLVERDVKRRRNDFELKSVRMQPFEKFQLVALRPYRTVNENNQETLDYLGMGLTLEGLKQLASIPEDSLKDNMKVEVPYWRFRLLMQLGRMSEALELLNQIRGPRGDESMLWYAGALGNYKLMDSVLDALDKQVEAELAPQRISATQAAVNLMEQLCLAAEMPALPRAAVFFHLRGAADAQDLLRDAIGIRSGWLTLRGVLALEVGNTVEAETHFRRALDLAGRNLDFTDRRIAERYLQLILAQRQK